MGDLRLGNPRLQLKERPLNKAVGRISKQQAHYTTEHPYPKPVQGRVQQKQNDGIVPKVKTV